MYEAAVNKRQESTKESFLKDINRYKEAMKKAKDELFEYQRTVNDTAAAHTDELAKLREENDNDKSAIKLELSKLKANAALAETALIESKVNKSNCSKNSMKIVRGCRKRLISLTKSCGL
jgi:hypothetical protein